MAKLINVDEKHKITDDMIIGRIENHEQENSDDKNDVFKKEKMNF